VQARATVFLELKNQESFQLFIVVIILVFKACLTALEARTPNSEEN
jgi:hypothetical protein